MKPRSFRFRLACISIVLSGLVLLVFGLVASWAISQSQIRTVDAELQAFGYRFVSRSGQNVGGSRQEDILKANLGIEAARYRFFTILDRRHTPLFQSSQWPDGLDPGPFTPGETPLDPQPDFIIPEPKAGTGKTDREIRLVYEHRFYSTRLNRKRYRIAAFRNPDVILVVGADLSQLSADMGRLGRAFLIALPGALAVIAFGAWWLGKKALRPILTLEEDMRHLSVRDLDQRLDKGNADVEFARIIDTYNDMLERLERSFHQANRFSADASHELKTPLAIMRGKLEQSLAHTGTDESTQEVFSDLLEQTGRQGAILESLLLLSRADSGRLQISAENLNLSELLETWMEDAELLAEEKSIRIESQIEAGIRYDGDPVLLQQVAHNLLANAVKYNHGEGVIRSSLRRAKDGTVTWVVANTGNPIPPDDRLRIFERFERGSDTATQPNYGVGLGLSLVKEIISAHGGTIVAGESAEGLTEFRIQLKPANISSV